MVRHLQKIKFFGFGRRSMNTSSASFKTAPYLFTGVFLLAGLYVISLYDYLLFHTLIELFSVMTAFVIFALAWHTRAMHDNHYLLFIGIALLFSGALDLVHTLAYKGMGIFPRDDGNLATQFWIAFRFVFSSSFLLGVFFIKIKPDIGKTFFLYLSVVSALIAVILLGGFPACYITGTGLTRFKIVSEYVICLLFLSALVLLFRKRHAFDPWVLRLMMLSLLFSIASEFSFTEYASVYGFANMLGHLFLLASVAAIYRAIVFTAVVEPSRLLFHQLERGVRERTAELVQANEQLEREIGERREMERRTRLTNELLKLYTQKFSRTEYLNAAVELIREWSECRHTGIRIADAYGNIPYESAAGYNPDFLRSEKMLSLRNDQCICTRVAAGKPDISDLALMTPAGSFFCNETASFMAARSEGQKTRYRGICTRFGFKSLAVVPIRHREKILGAIHIADERPGMVQPGNVEFVEQLAVIVGEALFRFGVEADLVRQREELVRMNEQLRNLSAHVDAVREGERTSIAREIHDELGQVLTAVKMDVSWLRKRLSPLEAKLAEKAGETILMIDGAIQSVKRISSDLRPGVLDDIGLAAAVEWAAKDFQKRTDIACTVTLDPENVIVDRIRSTALFRVFQEALTNIMRHAEASHVAISLSQKDEAIMLSVTDNGKGIRTDELASPYAFGLIGMRERVQFLHGTITIQGVPNSGTTVAVTLPIHSQKEQSGIPGHAGWQGTREEADSSDRYAGGTEQ
jgi:signal transduction histidine kinase